MEICIKINNPTEEELYLIKELSREEETANMKNLLFREMPNMFADMVKKEKDVKDEI